MSEAKEITKKSQSNLAFAFISLPKEKRQDIMTFYAFLARTWTTQPMIQMFH